MPRKASRSREEIADIAANLTYQQGFNRTTLANVASAADVPLGSIYYYFRSKHDLGLANIDALSGRYEKLRQSWDAQPTPKQAILAFIEMTEGNAEALSQFGCPIGSLSSELGKGDDDLQRRLASIFSSTQLWMQSKFQALGFEPKTASDHALHVLTVLEGASLLSHMFSSQDAVANQTAYLKLWLDQIAPGSPEYPDV